MASSGKRIVRLRFDTWTRVAQVDKRFYEILQPCHLYKTVDDTREASIRARVAADNCPMCSESLTKVREPSKSHDATGTATWSMACAACGYWRSHIQDAVGVNETEVPHVKRFNYESETPSLIRLSSEIKKDISKVSTMDPTRFEQYVGSVLADFFDSEVRHVGRTGDGGVDLIAVIGDEPLMVQVKRREDSDQSEGVEVVKLLFASTFARGAKNGMVVTSAKKFSRQAREWIESPKLKGAGFNLELVDLNSLMSMVDAVAPADSPAPWERHEEWWRRYRPVNASGEWVLKELVDGEVLIGLHTDRSVEIVLFEHADLSKCYTATARNADVVNLFTSKSRAHEVKSIVGNVARLQVVHEMDAYAYMERVTFKLKERLIKRWCKKFPDDIWEFEP
jgi:hypothetical protein